VGGWGSKDSRSEALVRTRMPWRRPIAVRLQGGREATLGQDTCVGWLQSRPLAFEWVKAVCRALGGGSGICHAMASVNRSEYETPSRGLRDLRTVPVRNGHDISELLPFLDRGRGACYALHNVSTDVGVCP